jgi:hypothetical protein
MDPPGMVQQNVMHGAGMMPQPQPMAGYGGGGGGGGGPELEAPLD